jgi:hypothetical protein
MVTVRLLAQPFNDYSFQPIATISGAGSAAFSTSQSASTTNGVNVVKADGFHYFLDASVGGATVGDTVQIYSFQIDYVSS